MNENALSNCGSPGTLPKLSRHGRALIVAPYIGEFGWELMNWQGRVRWEIELGGYERVIVCVPEGRQTLYASRAALQTINAVARLVQFITVDVSDLPGEANEDHRVESDGRPIEATVLRDLVRVRCAHACEAHGLTEAVAALRCRDESVWTFLTPGYCGEIWSTTPQHQRFVAYRHKANLDIDILLVPRRREVAAHRNQPQSWWADLADRLERAGLRVAVYGATLDEAISQLSMARLAMGASTGGLHLASICRCPHFVWGPGAERRWTRLRMTNQQRYETVWNPFGTPCQYDPCGWQPTVDYIAQAAQHALDRIGLRGDASHCRQNGSAGSRTLWHVRRGLSRLMDPAWGSAVPWRLREFVRNHLV